MNIRRGAILLCWPWWPCPTAQAQWVMVARAVSGRIQRMEQQRRPTTEATTWPASSSKPRPTKSMTPL